MLNGVFYLEFLQFSTGHKENAERQQGPSMHCASAQLLKKAKKGKSHLANTTRKLIFLFLGARQGYQKWGRVDPWG